MTTYNLLYDNVLGSTRHAAFNICQHHIFLIKRGNAGRKVASTYNPLPRMTPLLPTPTIDLFEPNCNFESVFYQTNLDVSYVNTTSTRLVVCNLYRRLSITPTPCLESLNDNLNQITNQFAPLMAS